MTLGVEEEPEKLEDTNHVMIIISPIYEGSTHCSAYTRIKRLAHMASKSIESDAICHIDGPPPCRSDNIAATRESNVVVEHSHLTQGVQICMHANQYPIFPHTNEENMALLLGLSRGSHPNLLYKESEIGNISYPTMHGNYVQGQQYPYWNGGYSTYNMHSSTSRGNDDQELN
ncbi:hypothetical protein DVH24_015767 [Malus domestica]|uniref:Uncharacterized protein n=1 Tax=Malus domestica TaxID=3750 RepID=A0A498HNM1_MALDO|nr:hypothetical protein DVH24_015767 [Malus domestica]